MWMLHTHFQSDSKADQYNHHRFILTPCALPPPHLRFGVPGEQRSGQVLVEDPHVVLFQSAPVDKTARTKL